MATRDLYFDGKAVKRRGDGISEAPLVISPKLAKALANPWRNRILIELHLRAMSPRQFVDEFDGGPGLSVIARYFRELREWGYLEVTEERTGGRRRGAVEKVHRAIQRVHFDTETWEALPRYLREECSGAILESLLLRIARAVEAKTFNADPDRHLSWKSACFDRRAWRDYHRRLDEILAWSSRLEAASADSVAGGCAEALPATVALLAFRSAPEAGGMAGQGGEADRRADCGGAGPAFLISAQMAKALANPWRNRILIELHLRPMSPRRFMAEFGGPSLPTIARYFRQLAQWGYLELVEERTGGRRRGATEKVYAAIRRAHFDTATWEGLPPRLRDECSGAVLDALLLQISRAVGAGTFDVDVDRHLSWKAVTFDRSAWAEYGAKLDEMLAWVDVLEAEAAARLASGDEEPMRAIVASLAFRSP